MFPSFLLLQLILLSVCAHIALAGARITTSLYALSLHAPESTIGVLIALFSLFPMLFGVTAGRLVDRIGIATPVTCACVAITAGCALPVFISGLPVLYLATLFIGTGFMVTQVASQHTVGAMSTLENRSSNFSWLALGYSVSGFCGPVIAGFVIDHARHRISYLVFCGFALAALSVAVFGRLRTIQPAAHAQPRQKGGMLELLRDAELRRIYLIGILLSGAWDLFTFVTPIHGSHLGLSASAIGLILGCFAVATFSVRLAMPWISRRCTEWQVLSGALILAVCCYAIFPFMRQPAALMAVAAVLGLAVGSSQPNMLALLHHCAPPGRAGEAVGIRVTMGNAGQVILPLVFGAAGATLGLPVVFLAMSAMIGSGVPIAWRKASTK
ncbi:MFS transporter [Noviherbaspirillum massiliense]|uniref:MFS transporter n=1 Tax=Noviherbaspirillum massiliense TaxID=1465823 RepID=UPI0002F07CB5|nr:MFS transporter [Noviherbaspirillum massiliense]